MKRYILKPKYQSGFKIMTFLFYLMIYKNQMSLMLSFKNTFSFDICIYFLYTFSFK